MNYFIFKNNIKAKLSGLISDPITYQVNNPGGDNSVDFGTYEGQRYGAYDTDCCWDFSATEIAETQVRQSMRLGRFSADQLQWLGDKQYIDAAGDPYFSRRWVAILSGVKSGGNDQQHFWDLASVAGLIPNSMLPYSVADAEKDLTRDAFDNDYFNPSVITQEMEDMGLEFLKRVEVQAQDVGTRWQRSDPTVLARELLQGSLQIGIPVPQDGTWNQQKVRWDGRTVADHAVELYKYDPVTDPLFPYFIYDSYEPHLKQLSADYYVPIVTKAVLTPRATSAAVVASNNCGLLSWMFGCASV